MIILYGVFGWRERKGGGGWSTGKGWDEKCLMNIVWIVFLKGVREEFEGIWRENLPSKPLNFNSFKLEEFGRRGEERRVIPQFHFHIYFKLSI